VERTKKEREKAIGMIKKKYKNIWMFQKFLDEDTPFFSFTVDGNRIFRSFCWSDLSHSSPFVN